MTTALGDTPDAKLNWYSVGNVNLRSPKQTKLTSPVSDRGMVAERDSSHTKGAGAPKWNRNACRTKTAHLNHAPPATLVMCNRSSGVSPTNSNPELRSEV